MLRRLVELLQGRPAARPPADPPAERDYTQDREDRRVGRLSDEDRAWELASQQRERDARDEKLPPRA